MLPTAPISAAQRDDGGPEVDGIPACPHEELIALYTHHFPTLAQPRLNLWRGGKNGRAMKERWRWVLTAKHEDGELRGQRLGTNREEGLVWFGKYFALAAESDWLSGRSKREGSWTCDLPWLVKRDNFEKVYSCQYENKDFAHV